MSPTRNVAWLLPPESIQRRVNAAFGSDQYQRLASAWNRAVLGLPDELVARVVPSHQYRGWTPTGTHGPVDKSSVHYLGLARDAGWAALAYAERLRLARALVAQGMVVENAAGRAWQEGQRLQKHLHFGIGKAEIRSRGLMPFLEEIARKVQKRAR